MGKPRYHIDFPAHMAQCEANYWRLLKLLPDLEARDRWRFGLLTPDGSSRTVEIAVIERSRYTTTLSLSLLSLVSSLPPERITARLYHDADVAEVLACEHGRNFESSYQYPNERMYQEDEKAQRNRFLGEWLSNCLNFGHSLQEIALA